MEFQMYAEGETLNYTKVWGNTSTESSRSNENETTTTPDPCTHNNSCLKAKRTRVSFSSKIPHCLKSKAFTRLKKITFSKKKLNL